MLIIFFLLRQKRNVLIKESENNSLIENTLVELSQIDSCRSHNDYKLICKLSCALLLSLIKFRCIQFKPHAFLCPYHFLCAYLFLFTVVVVEIVFVFSERKKRKLTPSYTVCPKKNGTLWVTVSRSCRFSAHILLTSTQNVPFYSGHCIIFDLLEAQLLSHSILNI